VAWDIIKKQVHKFTLIWHPFKTPFAKQDQIKASLPIPNRSYMEEEKQKTEQE
jgi:hypothetical protein